MVIARSGGGGGGSWAATAEGITTDRQTPATSAADLNIQPTVTNETR